MTELGLLLSDVPTTTSPAQQFRDIVDIAHAAERNGFTYIVIGQHFLYGDLRWLQPVPVLARLAAEVGPQMRLGTQIMIAPLYHPVMLAEEIATLDVVTEGRLVFGIGLGYRREEFDYLGVPYGERAARMDECLELMIKLWTEDEVSYHGKYFRLDDVRPHIQPIQKPHMPLWIGAHSLAGAKRAGRFGASYACPPEAPLDEVRDRYRVVRDGWAGLDKPFAPQPLRRNVLVADTDELALQEYARVAQGRYLTYVDRGLDVMAGTDLRNDFAAAIAGHAVVGSPDTVRDDLVKLVSTLPVEPLLLRPQWPSMDSAETIAAIDRLGRDIVPDVRAIAPSTEIVD